MKSTEYNNVAAPQRLLRSLLLLTMLLPMMGWAQAPTEINTLAKLKAISENPAGSYIITADIDASDASAETPAPYTTIASFTGTLEAAINPTTKMPYRIKNLSKPLFTTLTGTVKNLLLDSVSISQSGQVGAVACVANGSARIYNVGILGGTVKSTGTASSADATDCCGGLVGLLDGNSDAAYAPRVVNCYSYANITGGNRVGGIVGFNNYGSSQTNMRSMVMNCMFYGDITGAEKAAMIYGGTVISNVNSGGLNNFNYYAHEKFKATGISSSNIVYNCALAVEDKFLKRIEFYRLLLNSNKKLAAKYASTASVTVNPDDMLKWVLETADRSIDNPMPYPVLKEQGYYPSIINPDFANAPDSATVGRSKGGKLKTGDNVRTLSVTIKAPNEWTNAPSGVKLLDANGNEITSARTITLTRTDKDPDRFNFNYDKVQLPYYNDYGTKNYTDNKVVTGWKITNITSIAGDPYTASNYDYDKTYSTNRAYFDYPNYNFADRRSANKDLYSVSGRVFSQGAYFEVPYGVTSITIEPYWGKAAYVADRYMDVVCTLSTASRNNYRLESITQFGEQFSSGTIIINGSEQNVDTTISKALERLSDTDNPTVYDYAVVLVGNLHRFGTPSDGTKPFTLMSVDLDKDNEPDYSLIYSDNDRHTVSPLRFDFLNIPGMAQVQKPTGTSVLLNAAIFRTTGWFEITNTALMYFSQYEYENTGTATSQNMITKTNSPLILLGGYIDQFVSAQSAEVKGKTQYIHVGGNVLINSFGMGTHGDGSKKTPHVPVSVTGGDYLGFYLTGTYSPNADIVDDNAECYISGGRFKELAGAAQEQIGVTNSANNGNVRWQIYHADITDFYGGGVNDAKPVQGNITTEIFDSRVATFCGGPKFGDMPTGKTVTTTAKNCTFGKFFGAGFGGNSYNRQKYYDATTINFANHQKFYYNPGSATANENEKGKYYDGKTTSGPYGKKGPGIATDFDYEFFVWTSGATGARFYIKFASFSLATCNNVTSTLTKCTINDNFYGGGSLGKVSGLVTSTLEDCTVKGNVFGAGYSATIPKIPVRNGGFSTYPSFNGNSGMFVPGVLSDTTDHEWKTVGNYPTNATSGMSNDSVVTTVDIIKSNLGSVGSVTLTIKGESVIGTETSPGVLKANTGNVYGGGDESAVTGNTTVILEGGATVLGNVYGGGNNGTVGGTSSVTIQNP